MALTRTAAILKVLSRGREPKLAPTVMKMFGASSLEECSATYELLGKAERTALDEAIERIAANGSAAFLLSVENEMV